MRAKKTVTSLEERVLRLHLAPFFEEMPLEKITPGVIRRWLKWLEKRNFAPSSRNRFLMTLRLIFNYAKGIKKITKAPTDEIRAEKISERPLPENKNRRFNKLLAFLREEENFQAKALLLLALTNAHKNEILSLNKNDILPEGNGLVIGNGENRHLIPLNVEAKNIVVGLVNNSNSPWLFPNRKNSGPVADIFPYWNNLRQSFDLPEARICDLGRLYVASLETQENAQGRDSLNTAKKSDAHQLAAV